LEQPVKSIHRSSRDFDQPLKVCYFGTYRQEYSRNRIMMAGLRQAGVEVLECHEGLWRDTADRVEVAAGGWFSLRFLGRLMRTYWRLFLRYWHVPEHDVVIVGYPGQLDVFLARLLCWMRRKPLVLDIFMSLYMIATDRNLDRRSPISIKLLKVLEFFSLRLPDLLIQDTHAYVDLLSKTYHLKPERFCLVPLGTDSNLFKPLPPSPEDDLFRVTFYGTFIPNHGVLNIVEAARIVQNLADIQFDLIGDGPDLASAVQLAQQYKLSNIKFLGWMEEAELVKLCIPADVLLGSFGTKTQSLITVHNKIYAGMAMQRPVLTGDSPAIREQFEDGKQIFLCKRDDPESLAKALLVLRSDPDLRKRLAFQGQVCYQENYTTEKIGNQVKRYLVTLLSSRRHHQERRRE
jgi:glycosyltransferase involved in cell wall biosynthesis